MILSNIGLNEIIIGTDSYYDLSSGNTVTIKSIETSIEKELYLLPTKNDRYIYWEYTLVSGATQEDLSNDIIFLDRGSYDITIYNNGEIIYYDNLFVKNTKPTINSIDDSSDIIYTIDD